MSKASSVDLRERVLKAVAAGYVGVENELFFRDNTMILLADAKKRVEGIVKAL